MSWIASGKLFVRRSYSYAWSSWMIKKHPGLLFVQKNFVTSRSHSKEVTFKEIEIPIPYGHIAAKAWGNENGIPVLAFHGWLDNAGTFDKLIPLLSPNLFVVAFDAPGHGLSSHRPPGSFYSPMDTMIDFKRVADFFQFKNLNIIGHSLGGSFAQLYASLFPEGLEKIVILDIYKVGSRSPEQLPELARKVIIENLRLEKKCCSTPPLYTQEAAAKRLRQGMHNEVTEESVRILLKRGTRLSDCGSGVIFTRDLRARTTEVYQKPSHEDMKAFMRQLNCEMLMIISKNTHQEYKSSTPEVIPEFLEVYEKHCKKFQLIEVEGNHFVHLNNPERIARLINQFLCSERM